MSTGSTPADAGTTTTVHEGPRRYRAASYEHGTMAALTRLHTEVSPGVLPAGPAGHVLVPAEVAAVCDRYETPAGYRSRAGVVQERLGRIPVGARELVALRIPGAGPAPGGDAPSAWQIGIAWFRLGLAERLLHQAVTHLRGRAVQATVTLNLVLVRAMVADAVGGTAEAHALLDADVNTTSLRRAHHSLDEVGRVCLHLFGAAGFLVGGPGSDVRASEMLADTYAPPTEAEWL